jgi:hypothetical protein
MAGAPGKNSMPRCVTVILLEVSGVELPKNRK